MISIFAAKPNVFKQALKRLLFRVTRRPRLLPYGGDLAVLASAERGLRAIGVPTQTNPSISQCSDTVWAIRGVESLQEAIRLKRQGTIKTLIAGPNVVVIPDHAGALMKQPEVDVILVPSQWNRDWWISLNPELAPKIRVWPAGVPLPDGLHPPASRAGWIVFKKRAPDALYQAVIAELKKRELPYSVIEYGTYTPIEYRIKLRNARGLIHLQDSESQGLALQEAWAHDVPTLVWEPGVMISPVTGHRWDADTAAPYMTDEAGIRFRSEAEFSAKLSEFIQRLATFSPRAYVERELSDAASARKFMEIIKEFGYAE